MPLFGPPNVENLKANKNVKGLIKALRYDKDSKVCMEAALALGQISDEKAVEPLIAALENKDKKVQLAAAWALGEIHDSRAENPLINALEDREGYMRKFAVEALGKIYKGWIPLMWGQGYYISPVCPIIPVLKDKEGYVRQAAAEALGEVFEDMGGDESEVEAVEPLIAVLKDEQSTVREATAVALGKIKDPSTLQPLITAIKDRESTVRKAAAAALVAIGAPAIKPLTATIKSKNSDVRQTAAWALERLGQQPDRGVAGANYWIIKRRWDKCVEIGKPAVRPLIAALKDKDGEIRMAAAESLGKIGDPRAVEPLIAALKDRDRNVRKAAASSLGEIGDARAVEPLINALNEWDKIVRQTIAKALIEIGPQAVEPLIDALNDGDRDVRIASAEVLVEIKDQRAIQPLIITLKDPQMRVEAAKALDNLGWKPDQGEVGATYWIAKGRWDKCVEIGTPAVKLLIKTFKDKQHLRAEVVKALGEIGDGQAVEPLIDALNDNNQNVRMAAAEALAGMYSSGNLDEKLKRSIVAKRDVITKPHSDKIDHYDFDAPCLGHDDSSTHYDFGIGVKFRP